MKKFTSFLIVFVILLTATPAFCQIAEFDCLLSAIGAEIDLSVTAVVAFGYAAPGDIGETIIYKLVASEPSHPGKFQDAYLRWFEETAEVANPLHFGAKCDGTTDDSEAILKARDYAQIKRVPFKWPAGTCVSSQTIEFTKCVPIIGEGMYISILIYTGDGTAIRIKPNPGWSIGAFHLMRDFAVLPVEPDNGVFGIEVTLDEGCNYCYWTWERVLVGQFDYYGVRFSNDSNNGLGNRDGFYCGRFEDCFFWNGFCGTRMGDSIRFDNVKIHGKNNLYITGHPGGYVGQRQFVISGGQITTLGGFIFAVQIDDLRVENVWMEHPGYIPYNVNFDSEIHLIDCVDVIFRGNTFNIYQNTSQPYHVIMITGSSDFHLYSENTFMNRGSDTHIYATSSTSKIIVEWDNHWYGNDPIIVLEGDESYHYTTRCILPKK